MPLEFGFKAETVVNEGRTTRESMNAIRDWSDTIATIPQLTDEQIVSFLLSCNNKEEPTKRTIKEFYSARGNGPELFNKRNPDNANLQQQLNVVEISVFPARTDDGSAIIFHRLQDGCYSNYHMELAMKLLFMTLDAAVYDYPPSGLIILFDMTLIGLMHLTRTRLGLVKKFCHYLQEGLPVQLRAIHVLNSVYFVEKVLAIIRPFMKKEVMDMIHFHPPKLDMEAFYEQCIPKKCLPSDFGGDLASAHELHLATVKKFHAILPFFEAEEQQRLDAKS